MSLSLKEFEKEENKRLKDFVVWYEEMAKIEPEKFPLTLPSENEGAWFEMFVDFDPEIPFYQLPKK